MIPAPSLPAGCRLLEVAVRDYALDFPEERDPAVAGVQLLVQHQGIVILIVDERGLAADLDLSMDTTVAQGWHAVKRERHTKPPIPVLEVVADPGEYRVGAFWLHDPVKLVAQ